jgi:hypothetical protein
MPAADMIRCNLKFTKEYRPGVVAYLIDGNEISDDYSQVLLIFNGNSEAIEAAIPDGRYVVIASGSEIGEQGIGLFEGDRVTVEEISMTILARMSESSKEKVNVLDW